MDARHLAYGIIMRYIKHKKITEKIQEFLNILKTRNDVYPCDFQMLLDNFIVTNIENNLDDLDKIFNEISQFNIKYPLLWKNYYDEIADKIIYFANKYNFTIDFTSYVSGIMRERNIFKFDKIQNYFDNTEKYILDVDECMNVAYSENYMDGIYHLHEIYGFPIRDSVIRENYEKYKKTMKNLSLLTRSKLENDMINSIKMFLFGQTKSRKKSRKKSQMKSQMKSRKKSRKKSQMKSRKKNKKKIKKYSKFS
jgi:hypothetical protein